MTDYTRLTVTGSARRVDVVVPSAEPLGAVLPRLIRLLDEPEGTVARPLTLVDAAGGPIDIARSPLQQDLLDGTALHLVRLDAAPPPPLVIDLTDAAADAHAARPDRWDERARLALGATAIGIATAAAGIVVPVGAASVLFGVHLTSLGVLLVGCVGFGVGRMPRVAGLFAAASLGLALPIGLGAAGVAAQSGVAGSGTLIGVAATVLTAALVLLLGVGVAQRSRGALSGGVIGAVLGTVLLVQLIAGMPVSSAAAVTGTLAAFLTGLLPWISLSAAGLTGLDQRTADGDDLPRAHAVASIDQAYSALTWGVAATATLLAVSGIALVSARSVWSALLALALALTAALRTRSFPLRGQVVLLWSAAGVIALAAVPALTTSVETAWIGVGACAAIAVIIAGAVLVHPRPHQRARLRSFGNAVEMIAVVSLLPLLLGVFDIYGDLLALFGGTA